MYVCVCVSQNKKQRMMVRAAVLKMKDPRQIIRDMEKLDEMGVYTCGDLIVFFKPPKTWGQKSWSLK